MASPSSPPIGRPGEADPAGDRDGWPSPLLAGLVVGLVILTFGATAWLRHSSGVFQEVVGAIWLAHGADLNSGVFYRDLIGPMGYGGSRYFPLFFMLIAGLLRAGATPVAAGMIAGVVSAGVLGTGLFLVARALGVPRPAAIAFGAAGLAPYFIQEAMLNVRADVLATGLNMCGVASVIVAWRRDRRILATLAWAAAFFSLAVSTKITSLAMPIVAATALLAGGRVKAALQLGAMTLAGALAVVLASNAASGGRALDLWRTGMLAGEPASQLIGRALGGDIFNAVGYSRLLQALLAIDCAALVALIASARRGASGGRAGIGGGPLQARTLAILAIVLFAGATATTVVILSSQGAVAANHAIEWVSVSFVILACAAALDSRRARIASVVVGLLVVWAFARQVVRLAASDQPPVIVSAQDRDEVVRRVAAAHGPVLSDSPLWEVLAGKPAYVLDPFALRVTMQSRPDVRDDVVRKLNDRVFDLVVLRMDPATLRGRRSYETSVSWPVIERVLANYHLDARLGETILIYVPN